ncbi:MAG: glutamine-synthetase adenylyltransferase, partial [Alphaproteobacteria bacterium]
MKTAFERAMTVLPLDHDQMAGQEVRREFADLGVGLAEFLGRVAGGSPFLRGLMLREAGFLRAALGQQMALVVPQVLIDLQGLVLAGAAVGLRQAKRRVALWTALCDLAGVWDLTAVTGALTALADAAVAVS